MYMNSHLISTENRFFKSAKHQILATNKFIIYDVQSFNQNKLFSQVFQLDFIEYIFAFKDIRFEPLQLRKMLCRQRQVNVSWVCMSER